MSNPSIPQKVRYAVWIAHNMRCAYTGDLVLFNNLEIDHVIPKKTSTGVVNSKISQYGLDKSFSINSIENFLPTFRRPNNAKGKRPFRPQTERFYLEIAEGKRVKVQEEVDKFENHLRRAEQKTTRESLLKELDPHLFEQYYDRETIGTSAVHLPKDVFDELVVIMQDFLKLYDQYYTQFEEFIKAQNLVRQPYSNYYKLLTTTREVWSKLINYSAKYDLNKGTSEEYSFNYNGNTIICLNRKKSTIKFWLIPATTDNQNFSGYLSPDNNVDILWKIPNARERKEIEDGQVWTAQKCIEWVRQIREIK